MNIRARLSGKSFRRRGKTRIFSVRFKKFRRRSRRAGMSWNSGKLISPMTWHSTNRKTALNLYGCSWLAMKTSAITSAKPMASEVWGSCTASSSSSTPKGTGLTTSKPSRASIFSCAVRDWWTNSANTSGSDWSSTNLPANTSKHTWVSWVKWNR